MADEFAHELSRTLALSNRYLMLLVEKSGLRGLAPSHGDVLVELLARKEISMSELSRRIERDPSTVTTLVKKLVAMGLAQTAKSSADRRSTMVFLTDKGRALEDDFVAISAQMSSVWRDGLDEAEIRTAQRVLEVMRDNLSDAIEAETLLSSQLSRVS